MKTMRKPLLISLLALTIQVAHAGGGGGFAGATEITQLANNTQLLLSYVEQAQQTVHQLNTYNSMLQSLRQLTPSSLIDNQAFKLWQDNGMTQTFRDLYRVVNNGQRVAYTLQSMDSMLRSINPGYGQHTNFDFQGAYRNWSDNMRYANISALKVGQAQIEDFASESNLVQDLTKRSQSADGQVRAIQAGNEIGVATIGQLQKLRQLQIAQMNAQHTVELAKQAREDQRRKEYGGKCEDNLTSDQIAAMRRRGENPMEKCH